MITFTISLGEFFGALGYTYRPPRRYGGYYRLYWRGHAIARRRSLGELIKIARIHHQVARDEPPGPLFDRR